MHSIIVVGLGFGDEGKGTIVDSLVRKHKAKLVVRFSGGFQAAHNVHTEEGKSHIFSQFGSGTFAGAETMLGATMIINPLCHQVEEDRLAEQGVKDALLKCYVHKQCIITTPFHKALNRVRELSRRIPHGSTGSGIGETVMMSQAYPNLILRAEDINYGQELFNKLQGISKVAYAQCLELIHDYSLSGDVLDQAMEPFYTINALPIIIERYVNWTAKINRVSDVFFKYKLRENTTPVIFEGSQGVLLDQIVGFHPYTTWANTTDVLAQRYQERWNDTTQIIGVTRTFMTRHGAGPFVSEHDTQALCNVAWDDDNQFTSFTGKLRTGYLDLIALKYAIKCCGRIDGIALTHCDKLGVMAGTSKLCVGYDGVDLLNYCPVEASPEAFELTEQLKKTKPMLEDVTDLPARLELELKVPVVIQSFGKLAKDKKYGTTC